MTGAVHNEQYSNPQEQDQQPQEQQSEQPQQQPPPDIAFTSDASQEQTIYKLQLDDASNDAAEHQVQQEPQELSSYFATPVGNSLVDELCETIGQLAAQSGYLHAECLFLIKRRLARFFEGRDVCSERGNS